MRRRHSLLATLTLGLLLSACAPRGPLRSFNVGDTLAEYTFTRSSEFEQGTYTGASLLIRDGVYRIDIREGDNELWWGQWGEPLADVIVDVEVEQVSQRNENAYGVMCRVRGHVGLPVDTDDLIMMDAEATAAPDATAEATGQATAPASDGESASSPVTPTEASHGDGYLFLIQGGGSYGIFRARGRDLTPLVDWQTSDAINVGPATNHLRAVCLGDYLAFYVNDTLVADTTDNTYQRGQVGLAASAANRLGARIQFDNLTVAQANTD